MTDFGAHPPQPAERRATRRWWPYFLFGPLPALLIAVVALALFLRTDHGLQRLESLLNSILADVGGQSIVLSGLHGRFPFDLRLDGLRLADADGTWLEIDALVLRWSGRDLLSAGLRVRELSARRLELHRTPLAEETAPKPSKPFQGVTLPDAFPKVAVERLAVEEIVLAEALAGKRTVLRLDADLDAGKHGLDANLRLETLEDTAGLLALRVGYSPAQDILDLVARFDDPQGSLAPLLGLPEATPLRLRLAGDGPPAAWSGTLAAQAGELITLDSTITMRLHERPDLSWTGQISVTPNLLPEPVSAYLSQTGPQTVFEVVLALPEPDLLRLERIHLENPKLRALLLADLDLGKAEVLGGTLTVEVMDTSPLNAFMGMDLGPSIQLDAEASGPLAGPDIRLSLTMQDIVAEPARVASLRLDANTRFQRDNDLVIAVTGSVRAQGLDVPDIGLPEALAKSLTATFDLAFCQEDSLLALHSLNLRGHGLETRADAELDLGEMRLAGKMRLLPTQIRPWLAPRDLDYQGMASLDIATQGTLWPLNLRIDVQAALDALQGLPAPMPAILGEAVALNATVLLSPPPPHPPAEGGWGGGGESEGTGLGTSLDQNLDQNLGQNLSQNLSLIRARDVSLRAEAFWLNAEAVFAPDTKILDASARLELPDLSRASLSPELDLSGSLVLEAHARGSVDDDLSLEAVLSSDDIAVAGDLMHIDAFPLRVVVLTDKLPGAPTGNISITTSPMNAPLEVRSDFALLTGAFHFSEFLLTLPQGRLTGQGHVDLDSKMVTAGLQGRVADIAPLARLAGRDMRGSLDIQAGIAPARLAGARPDGQAPKDAEKLNADLRLDLAGFSADFGTLDSLAIRAQARLPVRDRTQPGNLLAKPTLDAEIGLQGLRSGQIRVDTLTAEATGSLRQLALSASARGHALHPFSLDMRATWKDNAPARIVHVLDIAGAFADQPLALSAPVSISISDNDLAVSPLLLEFGQGVIRGQARIEDHEADLRLGVEKLPLELFTDTAQGTLTAGVVLSGPTSALAGHATVLGQGLSPKIHQVNDSLALDLHAEAQLNDQGLTFEAALHTSGDRTPLLQAGGQVPLRLALEPAGLDLPENLPGDARLSAFAKGELDLQWLGEMLFSEIHHLAGALNLDLELGGTLKEPRLAGRVEIQGAVYQHLQQGVLLQNINALATLEHNQVRGLQARLHELTATDNDQGRLSIQGQAGLHPDQDFPFHFTVQAADLNILDSPLAHARLADVALDVSGSTAAQEIKGHVAFDHVEVFLRELGGPRVVELHVIEINTPDYLVEVHTPRPTPTPPTIALDVDVRFPARVFVHGRGLDSEWGGKLHVSGNADQPSLRGEIRPVRGRLDMLGKRFTLSRESVIQFVGAQPPTPFVNIRAEQQGKDHVFFLIISGVPPDIEIRPEAEPPLPEDEVLSQMLFGRSLSSITPVQAARLALAVRELAGHGAGMDVLGTARDLLLLDDLGFVAQEEGKMGLRAGKHVHERVYMRLDSDLKTGEEQVSVDVELTPRIGLESRIGPKGGGLGLFWRHDY